MDRKAMIREYKETARPMGVYRVLNTANGKSLVGSCVDLPAMLNRLRFQLELGSHPDRALQGDWNESGPEVFTFEILDTLKPSDQPDPDVAADLRLLEGLWLDKLGITNGAGYGSGPKAGG